MVTDVKSLTQAVSGQVKSSKLCAGQHLDSLANSGVSELLVNHSTS